MNHHYYLRNLSITALSLGLLVLTACSGGSTESPASIVVHDNAQLTDVQPPVTEEPQTDPFFAVTLTDLNDPNQTTEIKIPNGRPIYALLVSGFHQNRNFELFHFYNFAKCLVDSGAYVHFAWWNNLLKPYMEGPLHDNDSVPSTGPLPLADMLNLLPFPALFAKAVPNDDFQFQADALALLRKIHETNPDAAIVLVGHSMGGDAVARLALEADKAGIEIAMLAPIDPVGNRSCIPNYEGEPATFCNGLFNFTRWRATHVDWLDPPDLFPWDPDFPDFTPYSPPKRTYSTNVKYLYHRWQQEFMPPFDFSCPPGGNANILCLSFKQYSEYKFGHPDAPVPSIYDGSTNVQSMVTTSVESGLDVFPPPSIENSGGPVDGHGEIVGFRGVIPFTSDSYPMALEAQGDWPTRAEPDRASERVAHLTAWETNPNYLLDNGFEPKAPELCMVSGDLCEILRNAVNLMPVADAGPDQTVECGGPNGTAVTLDGSGSSDPNGNPLTYTWDGPFGTLVGMIVNPEMPMGTHEITLTVEDDKGKSDTDTVLLTIEDTTSPSLSVSLSPDTLWPPNHKLVDIVASIQVNDVCDANPTVMLVSISSNEPDNGLGDGDTINDIQGAEYGTDDRLFSLRAERSGTGSGRIYTATCEATDNSANAAVENGEVKVPH